MNLKKSLALSKMGHNLLGRKKQVLLREMMRMVASVNKIKTEIDTCFFDAYSALRKTNATLGLRTCYEIAQSTLTDAGLKVNQTSLMGVELISVDFKQSKSMCQYYLTGTDSQLDATVLLFNKLKQKLAMLAELEHNIYRLALSIKKTEKRTNALKNLVIPKFEENIKYISDVLEEHEREEFSHLKVIKRNKENL
ncbi:MAG: V-type ATP synthase subunit D [Oscillospiraceae bacterium]|nr:V-type ATP synthase subunit D [Oscillospiraceae bacterium]